MRTNSNKKGQPDEKNVLITVKKSNTRNGEGNKVNDHQNNKNKHR